MTFESEDQEDIRLTLHISTLTKTSTASNMSQFFWVGLKFIIKSASIKFPQKINAQHINYACPLKWSSLLW